MEPGCCHGGGRKPGLCLELRVAFAKGSRLSCHHKDVPVGITTCKQQKSALVVLGGRGVYWKNMYWLTEWIGRREPGWEMSVKQPWGLGGSNCLEVPAGLPLR